MVTALDDVVGNVTKSLKDLGMYKDTIIIFTSDNGGIKESRKGNLPLKGNLHELM
jgi:arylsulfatase A-like enzyme